MDKINYLHFHIHTPNRTAVFTVIFYRFAAKLPDRQKSLSKTARSGRLLRSE